MLDYDTIRRLSGLGLKICLVLDYHPEGLTADEIRGILGISKAGFYRGLDAVSKVRHILKNETKFVLEMRKSLNFEKEKEKNQKKNKLINFKKEEEEARPRDSIDDSNGLNANSSPETGEGDRLRWRSGSPPENSRTRCLDIPPPPSPLSSTTPRSWKPSS